MKKQIVLPTAITVCLLLAGFLQQGRGQSHGESALTLKSTITLPNVKGRIDHMDVDLKSGRVFIAALENNTVEVVSLKEGKWLQSLGGFEEPQGVLYRPESNRLYVTNGGAGTCSVMDASTLKIIKTIPGLDDADNIRFDNSSGLVYVAYGRGGIAAIDPSKGDVVHTLPLTAHPESFQLESKGNRLYVNVPNEKKVVVFDRAKKQAVQTWILKEAANNYPMALDEEHQLLFVGCRAPARLLVLNAKSGAILRVLPIGGDVDDVFFDGQRHRLYVSCGEGVVDVIAQEAPDKYRTLEQIPSRSGARTSLFVPSLNTLLVVGRENQGESAKLRVYSIINK